MNKPTQFKQEARGGSMMRLVRGLRAMQKWGLGPSGGGGTVDDWSSGRREAEERMRKELRRLLREFDAANDKRSGPAAQDNR